MSQQSRTPTKPCGCPTSWRCRCGGTVAIPDALTDQSRTALVGALHGTLGLAERLVTPAVDIAQYTELCEMEAALRRMLRKVERAVILADPEDENS